MKEPVIFDMTWLPCNVHICCIQHGGGSCAFGSGLKKPQRSFAPSCFSKGQRCESRATSCYFSIKEILILEGEVESRASFLCRINNSNTPSAQILHLWPFTMVVSEIPPMPNDAAVRRLLRTPHLRTHRELFARTATCIFRISSLL